MIRGVVYKNRPLVKIAVGSRSGVREVVALVDTGFTSELKISNKIAGELGLKITHTEQIELGDEKEVWWGASLAFVALEGMKRTINVLISDGELSVIGIGLLKKFSYNLNVDLKHDLLMLEKQEK